MDRLKLIGDDWDKVYRLTKVYLKEDREYPTFDNKTHKMPSGEYTIEGFYANAMKLIVDGGYPKGKDYVIPSVYLKEFYRRK
jgi:hypothetical protein